MSLPCSDPLLSVSPLCVLQDLQTYIKQALLPEHRIVILGTSRHPENGDAKALKGFFDKFLYIPYPDYPSRLMLWKTFMREAVGAKVQAKTHTAQHKAHTPSTKHVHSRGLKTKETCLSYHGKRMASRGGFSEDAYGETLRCHVSVDIGVRGHGAVRLQPAGADQ